MDTAWHPDGSPANLLPTTQWDESEGHAQLQDWKTSIGSSNLKTGGPDCPSPGGSLGGRGRPAGKYLGSEEHCFLVTGCPSDDLLFRGSFEKRTELQTLLMCSSECCFYHTNPFTGHAYHQLYLPSAP